MLIDCLYFHLKTGNIKPTRDFFDKYYMPLVEIKDFNALIDNKIFFAQLVNKKQASEKRIEMSRNDNYLIPGN